MTIEEIKDQVARESKFINSWELIDKADWHTINEAVNEIVKRYAAECCKASLENACINMNHHYPGVNTYPVKDESNITLL